VNYAGKWKQIDYKVKDRMPFFKPSPEVLTDFHIYQAFFELVPEGTTIHMANSSVIRYCQLFDPIKGCTYFANRGTSGIDGSTSTAVGYASTDQGLNILLTGDVSFLYDSNALRLRALAPNLKIILINNQGGGIFRIIEGAKNSEQLTQYLEAQHTSDGKLAEHAGWSYQVCSSVDSIEAVLQDFMHSTAVNFIEFKTDTLQSPQILKDFFTFVR
jgi:2-succinyl-5-enolpyruvyl-6-hydroxy-3-cyclohexene-1-carboxylate synthase